MRSRRLAIAAIACSLAFSLSATATNANTKQAVPPLENPAPHSGDLIAKLQVKGCKKFAAIAVVYSKTHTEKQTVDLVTQLLKSDKCE